MTAAPSPNSPPPVRRPFFLKIAIVVSILSTVSLVGLGATVLRANEQTLQNLAWSRQHLALEDVAHALDDTLRQTEDALESVGRAIMDVPDEQASNIATLVIATVSGESELDAVGVYRADGSRMDLVREAGSITELPESLDEDLRTAAAANGSATGVVESDRTVLSVVPLRTSTGVTGYVATRTSLTPLSARIGELSARHFDSIEDPILLVDAEGRIVASSQSETAIVPAPEAFSAGLQVARSGSFAHVVGTGEGESLVTIESVLSRPFRVIVREPTSIVYASLAQLRLYVIGAVILAIVFSLVLSFWLAQRLTAPIRKLVEQADNLANRRFDMRISIDTGDEMGVLGYALSQAAEDLEASEEAVKKEIAIRQDLGRYLPAEIVDRVVARKQDMGLGGTKRAITVLFADVVGFTPLTEKLAPEDTVKLLNELFTLLTEIVFRHGGTLDKFMGDSVMAVFGAPTVQEDHATRAVACAEDMLRFLETVNAGWKERWGVHIELAIGVSSGDAVVGNIGSEARMEYTAIGDIVNIAARLEAIARPNQILLPKATADLIGDTFELIDRGKRELPGKKGEVHLFEVVV